MALGGDSRDLVGRGAELEAIAAALRQAADGGHAVVAIFGEAGIGKSALLAEVRARSEVAGFLALEGRAAEHERAVPFGVVIDALDDHVATVHERRIESLGAERRARLAAILPALSEHAGAPVEAAGPAERFRYHRALAALLELLARERPLALLLDDLHWADSASVEFVLHLLRRSVAAPLLLAFAMRPVDPMPRLLDALRSAPTATALTLAPLPREAALELLVGVGDERLRERLEAEAGGNPLYLHELARLAKDPDVELPPTLVAAVQLEVGSLAADARGLVDGAAVAGDPFDPELAAAAADLDAENAFTALDELVAAGLVRPAEGSRGFRFRHPVVRRAIYDATPAGWRLRAHERAANALAARGAAPALRAHHVEQAAQPGDDAAIELLKEAAAESADAAPAAAARWYATALRLLPAGEPVRRIEFLAPMAHALASAGQLEESRTALLEAIALMPTDAEPLQLGLIAACAAVEHLLGRHGEARRRISEALASLSSDAPRETRAALEFELAAAAFFTGDVENLRRCAGRAAVTAGDSAPALRVADEAAAAAGGLWGIEPDVAIPALDGASAGFRALDDAALAARPDAAWYLGVAELCGARYADSLETSARGLRVVREARLGAFLAPLATLRAMTLYNTCEMGEAREQLEVAEETSRLQGVRYQLETALWMRAVVADAQGDPREAHKVAAACREVMAATRESLLTRVGLCGLSMLQQWDHPKRCVEQMLDAGGPQLDRVDPAWSTFLVQVLVRCALRTGDLDAARAWVELLEQRVDFLRLEACVPRATSSRAELLLAEGDPGAAAELACGAAREAEERGAFLDSTVARLVGGQALAANGRRDEALIELRRVADDAGRGGHARLRGDAVRELRKLGVRLAAAPGTPVEPDPTLEQLSDRERQIVELVAEGHSNKEVAATLFLSTKTVEHHLSRVYAKLGMRSRVELASFARPTKAIK